MRKVCFAVAFAVAGLSVGLWAIGGNPNDSFTEVGVVYPVDADRLTGRSSGTRTGREIFDFNWSFERETFSLTGTHIPADLLQAFCDGKTFRKVAGQWHLDEMEIVFDELRIDGSPIDRSVRLRCFNTGVIRIETGEAQYVF